MILSCALCNTKMDTKKDTIKVIVKWVLEELLKLNGLNYKAEFPRIVKICNDCWDKKLEKKPENEDLGWEFNKEV